MPAVRDENQTKPSEFYPVTSMSMRLNRVGSSGLEVSDVSLGTFEWGRRIDDSTAQDLLDVYAEAGGVLVETPSFSSPAADVLGSLTVPENIAVLARVGIVVDSRGARLNCGRSVVRSQTEALLRRLGTERIDVLALDGFDEETPLEETVAVLGDLCRKGDVGYIAAAHHTGWQLAVLAASGLPLVAALNECSLLERSAETEVFDACEYLGLGVIAGAGLGRGVLTGQYSHGFPRTSRGAGEHREYVEPFLDEERAHVVAGVTRAAAGLGVDPVDVALAWNRSLPVASTLVAPRTVEQLRTMVTSELELEDEIIDALDQISAGV